MKRIFITTVLLLAVTCGFACSKGKLTKRQSKKVKAYFTQTLQGTDCEYSNDKTIDLDNIQQMRTAVWNCWREAVKENSEIGLIAPFTKDEPRDTGYWRLPEELEPEATMPYYFIRKGEKPDNGYPLFLYMHGSGNKVHEWETGYILCNRYDDAPSLHFIPQIPNGYGELYRWAIQSKQWAWEKLLCLAFLEESIDPNRI